MLVSLSIPIITIISIIRIISNGIISIGFDRKEDKQRIQRSVIGGSIGLAIE
jgi:hypothetical protein